MRLANAAAIAATTVIALSACSPKGGANSAATGGRAPQAAATGPDTPIAEGDLPHLRAGYWEIKTKGAEGQAQALHFCDAGKPVNFRSATARGCSQFNFRRTFTGGIVMDAQCLQNGVSSTIHVEASGDFNSAYSSDMSVTMTKPGEPPTSFKDHTDARWVGDCPPGEKPVDVGSG
jgi:hypothetical protein